MPHRVPGNLGRREGKKFHSHLAPEEGQEHGLVPVSKLDQHVSTPLSGIPAYAALGKHSSSVSRVSISCCNDHMGCSLPRLVASSQTRLAWLAIIFHVGVLDTEPTPPRLEVLTV